MSKEKKPKYKVWSGATSARDFDDACQRFMNECGDGYTIKSVSEMQGFQGDAIRVNPLVVIIMERTGWFR